MFEWVYNGDSEGYDKKLLQKALKSGDFNKLNERANELRQKGESLDLRSMNLRGADLSQADLVNADLKFSTLDGAILPKNLSGVQLYNDKYLPQDLSDKNLQGANLNGYAVYTNLSGSNLKDAKLITYKLPDRAWKGIKINKETEFNITGELPQWAKDLQQAARQPEAYSAEWVVDKNGTGKAVALDKNGNAINSPNSAQTQEKLAATQEKLTDEQKAPERYEVKPGAEKFKQNKALNNASFGGSPPSGWER